MADAKNVINSHQGFNNKKNSSILIPFN